MRGFWAMLVRELKALRKEKTILFAILIQLFIASFSSVILTGIMAYYDPDTIGQNVQYGLDIGLLGDTESRLCQYLRESTHRVIPFQEADKAESAFKSGKLDAIIYLPDDSQGVVEMKLVLPDMDAQATIVLMLLRKPLEKYEAYLRARDGISVRYQDVEGKPFSTYEFLYTIIIPVLMFFPAFIAGSMVIDSIAEEIEHKTLDTLLSAPVSISLITGAKIVASLLVGIAQCAVWLILLRINGFAVENALIILLLSLIMTGIVAIIALYVVMLFRDRERSQFIYSLVILVLFSLTYFISLSPFTLVARLATADPYVGFVSLIGYIGIFAILLVLTPLIVKRVAAN